jgi:hypothetical protein
METLSVTLRIHSNAFAVVRHKSIVMSTELLRYSGNATNSLLRNRTVALLWKCYITHCYTAGTITSLWICHQGA